MLEGKVLRHCTHDSLHFVADRGGDAGFIAGRSVGIGGHFHEFVLAKPTTFLGVGKECRPTREFYRSIFFPVAADSRAASRISTTVMLISSDDRLPAGSMSPRVTAAR